MIHVTLMRLLPGVEETAHSRHSQKPAEDRCLILVHRSPWFSNWHFIFLIDISLRDEGRFLFLAWGKDKKYIFFLLLRSPKIVIESKGRIWSTFVHTKAIQPKIKVVTSSAQSSPRASAFPFKQFWFASIFSLGKLQLQCYSWRILYIFRG